MPANTSLSISTKLKMVASKVMNNLSEDRGDGLLYGSRSLYFHSLGYFVNQNLHYLTYKKRDKYIKNRIMSMLKYIA